MASSRWVLLVPVPGLLEEEAAARWLRGHLCPSGAIAALLILSVARE